MPLPPGCGREGGRVHAGVSFASKGPIRGREKRISQEVASVFASCSGRTPPRFDGQQETTIFTLVGAPRSLAVGVVVVPPFVGRRLRVALRRVLPLLLAAERGHVQVAPGGSHGLVTAAVDEIGAVDLITLADEGVVPVPLVDAEILVPVAGDRVPGDVLPPVALLQLPDLGLRRARGEHERHIPRVQVGGVGDLVRDEGAAHARPLGVRIATLRVRVGGDLRPVEGAVDDQLTAALEQVGKRGRPVRALEAVLLLDRHPRHPAALGRERVTGSGVLLLLDEQFLAGGLPLLGGDDGGCVHFAPSSFRYSPTTSMKRPQTARWRSIHSATSRSTSSSSDRTCVRPRPRVTTPVSSSTFTCLVIAGLVTAKPGGSYPCLDVFCEVHAHNSLTRISQIKPTPPMSETLLPI